MNGFVDLGTISNDGICFTTSGTGNYVWPTFESSGTTTYTWTSNTVTFSSTYTVPCPYDELYAPGYNAPVIAEPGELVLPAYNARLIAHAEAEHTTRAQRLQSAESRAEKLLRSMLTADQKAMLTAHGYFEVFGSAGNLYRINWGTAGNVDHIDHDGRRAAVLCAHPDMREQWLPTADVMLAQMLALMTDEPAFIRKANVHAGRRPNIDNVIQMRAA